MTLYGKQNDDFEPKSDLGMSNSEYKEILSIS